VIIEKSAEDLLEVEVEVLDNSMPLQVV